MSGGPSMVSEMAGEMVADTLAAARRARLAGPPIGDPAHDAYLKLLATGLRGRWDEVTAANAVDIARVRDQGQPEAIVERVRVDDTSLTHLERVIDDVRAAIPDLAPTPPVTVDGMTLRRVPKPIGVILFVYEARPTVTVEGAAMAVAAGNAVILRGGSEIAATNHALAAIVTDALAESGLPGGLVQVLADGDRARLRALLKCHDDIDLLIPRGSPSLISACRTTSTIPMLASGGGVNHLYVHASADPARAAAIALDSKLAEPTACNTVEMLLIDRVRVDAVIAALVARSEELGIPFGLRVPPESIIPSTGLVEVEPIGPHDAGREFLSRTIAVTPVDGPAEAITHIRAYGSSHTEGVVADDPAPIAAFLAGVDAAAIVVNGSLRLHDGPTMGLGPEISISTGRMHVRGPVGLTALVTHGWVIEGHGRLREAAA